MTYMTGEQTQQYGTITSMEQGFRTQPLILLMRNYAIQTLQMEQEITFQAIQD